MSLIHKWDGSKGYFKIVDDRTLAYGSKEHNNYGQYTKSEVSLIDGNYSSGEDEIEFRNNKFKIETYPIMDSEENITGNYTINDNTIYLEYEDTDNYYYNNIKRWFILDNDTIIAETKFHGTYEYVAYLR